MAGALNPAGSNQQIPLANTFKPGDQRVQDDSQRGRTPEQTREQNAGVAGTRETADVNQAQAVKQPSQTGATPGRSSDSEKSSRGSLLNVIV